MFTSYKENPVPSGSVAKTGHMKPGTTLSLDKVHFLTGAPILKLDLTNPDLSGEVSTAFKAIAQ